MPVVKIENGKVVQTWRDVPNIAAAMAKYGFGPANLVEGDHPSGTLYDGAVFTAPPPSPPPEPRATGAQMIYEAETRGQLATLLTALTEPERAKLYARRRIVAGDDIAEALRARLGVSALAMENFIAAASGRAEV